MNQRFCPFRAHFAAVNLPRVLPWAMRFCPFGATLERLFINHNLNGIPDVALGYALLPLRGVP